MHPYGGNSGLFPDSVELPDDGIDVPSFVILNTAPSGVADRTAYLRRWVELPQWRPSYAQTALPSASVLQCAAWDPYACKWLMAGQVTSTLYLQIYEGAGADAYGWQGLIAAPSGYSGGAATGVCRGIEATTPVNRYVYVGYVEGTPGTSTGSANMVVYDTNTGLSSLGSLPDTNFVFQVAVYSCAAAIVIFVGATSSADTHIYRTSAAAGFATTIIYAPSLYVPEWAVAQQPPTAGVPGPIMAIPVTIGGVAYNTGPLSGGMLTAYSVDGVTWSSNVFTGLVNPSAEGPKALAAGLSSSGTACWTLTTWDGTVTRLYQSVTNGASWTLLTTNITGLTTAFALGCLTAIGRVHVAVLDEGQGSSGNQPGARIIASPDSGITWSVAANRVPWNSSVQLGVGARDWVVLSDGIHGTSPIVVPSFSYGLTGGIGQL